MKKITNVNIGGYPFTIDHDAYAALNNYLTTIEGHFSNSEGCDEILEDIEARIAEIFSDSLKGKEVVGMKEFSIVVETMGRPEDFGAESIDHEDYSNKGKKENRRIKTGKRLFRDEDDKVIGGVCSGVAAYFGVEDPLWVRLIFVLAFFTLGVPIVVYILLWAIVPRAVTAGDKLKMRGEPATVSNIAKTIEEELTDLSGKISDLGKEFSSKK